MNNYIAMIKGLLPKDTVMVNSKMLAAVTLGSRWFIVLEPLDITIDLQNPVFMNERIDYIRINSSPQALVSKDKVHVYVDWGTVLLFEHTTLVITHSQQLADSMESRNKVVFLRCMKEGGML